MSKISMPLCHAVCVKIALDGILTSDTCCGSPVIPTPAPPPPPGDFTATITETGNAVDVVSVTQLLADLLLHFEGSNLSNTDPILDSSIFAHPPLTRTLGGGNATFVTAIKKFGSTSIGLTSAPCSFYTEESASFGWGTGDYTFEWQNYQSNVLGVVSNRVIFDTTKAGAQLGVKVIAHYDGAGNVQLQIWVPTVLISSGTIPYASFVHLRVCRVAGILYFFLDGSLIGTAADTRDYGLSGILSFGDNYLNSGSPGSSGVYMDEFRCFKGVGISTTDFTPPVAAFGQYYPP